LLHHTYVVNSLSVHPSTAVIHVGKTNCKFLLAKRPLVSDPSDTELWNNLDNNLKQALTIKRPIKKAAGPVTFKTYL
jgi:hypothetical protein